jgi:hypothetical protein
MQQPQQLLHLRLPMLLSLLMLLLLLLFRHQ